MTEESGRWYWRAAAMALVALQLPVVAKTAADPTQSDFANYYTPAFVLARGGDVGSLYGRDAFEGAMRVAGIEGLGSFIPHPPTNALWLLPFATLTPAIAKGLWTGVLLFSLGFCVIMACRLPRGFGLAMAAILVFAPTLAIRNSLAFGQPYPILAALLVAGVVALEGRRDFIGGFLLGLGGAFKPYALIVVFLFLSLSRRRALVGFLIGCLTPCLLLWSLAGAEPFVEFWSKVAPWMARGEIQDPFSPGWGSATALANRLFRFEPDLNPLPWADAPIAARFIGAAVSACLLALGVLSGRRALDAGRPLEGVGVAIAFALAASPFGASYHLVLLVVPVLALACRLRGRALAGLLLGWFLLGSSLMNSFKAASGLWTPLAFARFFGAVGLALAVSWPFLSRRVTAGALALGVGAGILALPWGRSEEKWPRVEFAKGYSMMRPYFCGATLRWWSPAPHGRRLESRGEGEDCSDRQTGTRVVSRFTDGSWNLYLQGANLLGAMDRLTFSDANEIDPAMTPDGCGVVFASDQGRGLGSSALYLMDFSRIIGGCDRSSLVAGRR